MKICRADFDLIVTIVRKGVAEDVMEHARKAGAEGGTILGARGTGIHEGARIFGIPIEPEKEVVLVLIDRQKSDAVFRAIYHGVQLEKPGNGIIFALDVTKVAGIVHASCRDDEPSSETTP